jgi:RNA polymerase sigma-70 factor (ECF subfamily)
VTRLLAAVNGPFRTIGCVVERHEVNGQPGEILRDRDGKVISTLALDIVDGRIQTIRAVIKPNKPGTSARSRAGTPPILRCATICRVPWSTR